MALAVAIVLGTTAGRQGFRWLRTAFYMQALPGPKSMRLLGDMTPARIFKAARWQSMWAKIYGSVYVQRAAHVYIVIVSDPTLMTDLFKLPRAFVYPLIDEVTQHRANMLSRRSDDPVWRAARKAVAPVFSQSNLQRLFPAFSMHVGLLLARLRPAAESGAPVDIQRELKMLLVHMLGHVAFEMDLADPARQRDMADALDAMSDALDALTRNLISPFRHQLFFWHDRVKRDAAAVERWNKLLARFATEAILGGGGREGGGSIIAALRAARLPGGRPLALQDMLADATLFFIAGVDTTGHTLAWTLLLLTQHAECVGRVAQELEECGLKGPNAREITFADCSRLSYLNACVKEAMRLEPVAAAGTWRVADRDLRIGGYFVPEGMPIALHFAATFTSPDNFPHADRFAPERWLSDASPAHVPATMPAARAQAAEAAAAVATDGVAAAARTRPPWPPSAAARAACPFGGATPAKAGGGAHLPQQMFPFSLGDRNCVGRGLAQLEMTLVLARLFALYRVELAEERNTVARVYEEETLSLTCGPHSLYVRLTPWEALSG